MGICNIYILLPTSSIPNHDGQSGGDQCFAGCYSEDKNYLDGRIYMCVLHDVLANEGYGYIQDKRTYRGSSVGNIYVNIMKQLGFIR